MDYSNAKHTSVWMDTTPQTNYPTLPPNINVDVAIIGGGIAGLTCAYMLKKAGKTVAVIEADNIAQGVSGFTTAHVTSNHNLFYDSLISTFGEEKAKLYAQANMTAIKKVENIVSTEKIDCDFKNVSTYLFAEKKEDVEKLQTEYTAAKKLGLSVTYEGSAPLPFKTYGAIHYLHQAQFHPRKYLLSLAEKIHGNNSFIFENTRVTDVEENETCVVKTEKGNLSAKDVIIATHFPILDRGGFFARMKSERSYVIGVYVNNDFPKEMFENTDDPYYYIRTQETEKGTLLIVGGQDHATGQEKNTEERYKKLEKYVQSHFDVKSIEYYWSSQDNYPFDDVPFIGKFLPTSKHMYVSTGFNGYGMTHGTIAGMLLTDMICGKKNVWEAVYTPQRFKVLTEGATMVKEGLHEAKMFIQGKLSSGAKQTIESLQPNRGKVIEIDNKKVAVYKDADGKVYTLSATCQHMGCTVGFNTAEKSWDCPCHGSRFDVKGKILHGPTVKELPEVEIS